MQATLIQWHNPASALQPLKMPYGNTNSKKCWVLHQSQLPNVHLGYKPSPIEKAIPDVIILVESLKPQKWVQPVALFGKEKFIKEKRHVTGFPRWPCQHLWPQPVFVLLTYCWKKIENRFGCHKISASWRFQQFMVCETVPPVSRKSLSSAMWVLRSHRNLSGTLGWMDGRMDGWYQGGLVSSIHSFARFFLGTSANPINQWVNSSTQFF